MHVRDEQADKWRIWSSSQVAGPRQNVKLNEAREKKLFMIANGCALHSIQSQGTGLSTAIRPLLASAPLCNWIQDEGPWWSDYSNWSRRGREKRFREAMKFSFQGVQYQGIFNWTNEGNNIKASFELLKGSSTERLDLVSNNDTAMYVDGLLYFERMSIYQITLFLLIPSFFPFFYTFFLSNTGKILNHEIWARTNSFKHVMGRFSCQWAFFYFLSQKYTGV